MNTLRKILLGITIVLFPTQQVYGGDNTYFKLESQESDLAIGLTMTALSGFINSRSNIYDNYIIFPYVNGTETLEYSGPQYFTARRHFKDLGLGLKLGYKSFSPKVFNWALYGSLHYAMNQFANYFRLDENSVRGQNLWNRIHRMQMGIGIKGIFGGLTSNFQFSIDAALRYNVPIAYGGDLPDGRDLLNSGISPVFSCVLSGGEKWLNGSTVTVGLYYEPGTYKIFKRNDLFDNSPYKMNIIGINLTWTLDTKKKLSID